MIQTLRLQRLQINWKMKASNEPDETLWQLVVFVSLFVGIIVCGFYIMIRS